METDGGLAQLGERLPCKQEVSGSIPLISTMYLKRSEDFSGQIKGQIQILVKRG